MPGRRLIVLAAAVPGGMRKYRCRPSCGVATVSMSGQGCPYTRHSAAKTATPSGPPSCRSRSRPMTPEARQPTPMFAPSGQVAGQHLQVRDLSGITGRYL